MIIIYFILLLIFFKSSFQKYIMHIKFDNFQLYYWKTVLPRVNGNEEPHKSSKNCPHKLTPTIKAIKKKFRDCQDRGTWSQAKHQWLGGKINLKNQPWYIYQLNYQRIKRKKSHHEYAVRASPSSAKHGIKKTLIFTYFKL